MILIDMSEKSFLYIIFYLFVFILTTIKFSFLYSVHLSKNSKSLWAQGDHSDLNSDLNQTSNHILMYFGLGL